MSVPRHVFTVVGAAGLLAAVALAGASIAITGGNTSVHAVGDFTPTPDPTAEPTTDPCEIQDVSAEPRSDLVMAQAPECTPTEETPPRTHTPTPESTGEPTEPVSTQPASTSTTAPPVATSTPSGDAGAGGLTPPSTGSNGDAGASNANWLVIIAGLALAIGGTSALGYSLRKS